MTKQLYFNIPVIDSKASIKEAESELEEYRRFLVTLPSDFMPAITPSYSQIPPSVTNKFHSSTENAAIERIEFEQSRDRFLERMHQAVNSLKQDERFIIIKRYMMQDLGYDLDIWLELGVGKTKYYKIKEKAKLRLAFALHVEVYKKRDAVKSA